MVVCRLSHQAGGDCRDPAEKGPGQYRAGALGECRLIWGEKLAGLDADQLWAREGEV